MFSKKRQREFFKTKSPFDRFRKRLKLDNKCSLHVVSSPDTNNNILIFSKCGKDIASHSMYYCSYHHEQNEELPTPVNSDNEDDDNITVDETL